MQRRLRPARIHCCKNKLSPRSDAGFFHVDFRAVSSPPNRRSCTWCLSVLFRLSKPDAVAKNVIGDIYSRFEKAGLKIVAAKYKQLSRREAEGFYAVHRDRPFFNALVEFYDLRASNDSGTGERKCCGSSS